MANTINLDSESGANFIGDDSQPSLTLDNSSTGAALAIQRRAGSNATIAPLQLKASANASAPALQVVTSGFASITSVVLTTVANTDRAIRVWVGGEPRWIPAFKDAAIIGAAAYTEA